MGRPLGIGEIRRMVAAENVIRAYANRKAAEDWAKWAEDHPDQAALLNYAMKAAQNG